MAEMDWRVPEPATHLNHKKVHFMKQLNTIDIIIRILGVVAILGIIYTAWLRHTAGHFF